MECSTIIVSYNTFSLTREAVATALTAAPGLESEVIVVDNASPDESARRLREAFAGDDRVRVIESGGNIGFSAANNVGAKAARGEILFFLNPDTLVHGDAIATLADHLRQYAEVGAVGPRVLNTDGTEQVCAAHAPSYRRVVQRFLAPASIARLALSRGGEPVDVDVVKGCSLAVRRGPFEAVGGWDESTFMYAEENELCFALQRLGLVNRIVPSAVITHHGGAASLDRYVEHQILATRNGVAFMRRYASRGLVGFHRAMGAVAFAARAAAFPLLALAVPGRRNEYRRRGKAAAALAKWFAFTHD